MTTTGRFYIVNHYDTPDARHITERREGGFYYIHPGLRGLKVYWGMQPENPTPLEDFGLVVSVTDGVLVGELVNPSRATYPDGRPRRWQGETKFSFKL